MSIWEGLVTRDEQEVYRRAGYGRPRGFGRRPALLVVDIEYNFTGERPEPILDAIARFKDSCGPYAWAAIPHIQRLLELARRRGVPVFYTHGLPPPGVDAATDRGTAIIDELKPRPDEAVLAKAAPSAFFGTPLAAWLVGAQVDTVIVAGATTSGCVRATVLDSYSYRFQTVVPVEAVFDRAETPHRLNLFDMAMKYAHVAPVSEVATWLSERPSAGKD
jgi:maleamate amidohydrolase